MLFLGGRNFFNKKEETQIYDVRLNNTSSKLEVVVKRSVDSKIGSKTPTCKRKAYSYVVLTGINKNI